MINFVVELIIAKLCLLCKIGIRQTFSKTTLKSALRQFYRISRKVESRSLARLLTLCAGGRGENLVEYIWRYVTNRYMVNSHVSFFPCADTQHSINKLIIYLASAPSARTAFVSRGGDSPPCTNYRPHPAVFFDFLQQSMKLFFYPVINSYQRVITCILHAEKELVARQC